MYILYKRHDLDDHETIVGVFDNKELVIKTMNELFEKDNHCYSVMYYELNQINSGKVIAFINVE